jgi:Na+-transporting NADH:ubiquinone oxidoreductase subunit NqrE
MAIKLISMIGENRNLWPLKLLHPGLLPLFELSFIKSISRIELLSSIPVNNIKSIIATKLKEFTTNLFKIIFLFLTLLSMSCPLFIIQVYFLKKNNPVSGALATFRFKPEILANYKVGHLLSIVYLN